MPFLNTTESGGKLVDHSNTPADEMAGDEQDEKERVSLYIDRDLYLQYWNEVMHQKLQKRDRRVSMNSLANEALRRYAKTFKKKK